MKEKVLYFEGAGCEGNQVNDVENCRIRTAFMNDKGEKIFLELSTRYTNFKKEKEPEYLSVSFCYYISDEPEVDDCNEGRFLPKDLLTILSDKKYSKKNILEFVNQYCKCSFDRIEVLSDLAGYRAFSDNRNINKGYNFMNDFINIPARTKVREKIYNEIAKDYFTNIYRKNIEEKNLDIYKYERELEYGSYDLISMNDNSITFRSYAYKELINDKERIKVFDVIY